MADRPSLGNTYGIASELYRPLTPTSRWFVAPRGSASDTNFKIYRMNDPLAEYRVGRATIGVDFGYGFSRFTEVRVGYEIGDLDAKLRLGTPEFASVSGTHGKFSLFAADGSCRRPNHSAARLQIRHAVPICGYEPRRDGKFPAMNVRLSYFQPVSKPGSIFFTAEGEDVWI